MPKDSYAIKRQDLILPELSFVINGILFDVYRQLGGGHQERYYEKAVAHGLSEKNIKFSEQYHVPLIYAGKQIGKYRLDFLIEDKIVLELKRGMFIPLNVINQTKQYLTTLKLQLGIVACYTNNGVIIKRVLNVY